MILGILAVIAVPKFLDLASSAKDASAKSMLGAVRSTLAITYAQAALTGTAAYPATLGASDFADGKEPMNAMTNLAGVTTIADADDKPGGNATGGADGFWYIQSSGVAGAYSTADGTDTSSW